ncbi:MauE/DoxX family redox-associated membrane protein [Croceitalea marina]|uniref:MauE/DoxX family redox-associated membrane protein n=1 Tax=Croceitalea marina TaxID=1775166 RepID=A0ABW5MSB0_9FLAO
MQKLKQVTPYGISMLFGALFLYAATIKLLNYREFSSQLTEPTVLRNYSAIMASVVLVCELVVSFLLFAKKFRLQGLWGGFGLISIYTIYLLSILNFSDVVPCSCLGVFSGLGWNNHIFFNAVLLAVALVGIYCSKRHGINLKQNTA